MTEIVYVAEALAKEKPEDQQMYKVTWTITKDYEHIMNYAELPTVKQSRLNEIGALEARIAEVQLDIAEVDKKAAAVELVKNEPEETGK